MQVTIVKADNFVSVDGVQKEMDLSFLPEDFHALQFDGSKGVLESSDIDKCEEFDSITKWSNWAEFDSKAKAAKNAPTAADFDEDIPEEDMAVSSDPEPEPEPEPPTDEEVMLIWRELRNNLLAESDIYVLKKLELGQAVGQPVLDYRQALRDLPEKVEAGSIPKPVFKDYEIIFNNWPVAPF